MDINLYTAWIAFLLGVLTGAVPGLFFHRENWLGGYNAWRRRLVRLAHISFFGLGILNLCLLWTFHHTGITTGIQWPSNLMVIGAITMPLVCYLSAWKMACRYLFPISAGFGLSRHPDRPMETRHQAIATRR